MSTEMYILIGLACCAETGAALSKAIIANGINLQDMGVVNSTVGSATP